MFNWQFGLFIDTFMVEHYLISRLLIIIWLKFYERYRNESFWNLDFKNGVSINWIFGLDFIDMHLKWHQSLCAEERIYDHVKTKSNSNDFAATQCAKTFKIQWKINSDYECILHIFHWTYHVEMFSEPHYSSPK